MSVSTDWFMKALCAETDPETFFPERGQLDAKRVCHRCEVRNECLEYALENNEEYGVWGGFTAEERTNPLISRRVA